jgi:hypothetical protein
LAAYISRHDKRSWDDELERDFAPDDYYASGLHSLHLAGDTPATTEEKKRM